MTLFATTRLRLLLAAFLWLCASIAGWAAPHDGLADSPASTDTTHYRLPPFPISDILDTPRTPDVFISPCRTAIALLGRRNLPPVSELASPEIALAGSRINPATNGPSRSGFYQSLAFQKISDGSQQEVFFPGEPRLGAPQWSPDGTMLALTNTVHDGIELWVVDVPTGEVRRLIGPELNAAAGPSFAWEPDSRSLVFKRILPGRGEPPTKGPTPAGPVIQESSGTAAPVRTYQDLLSNRHDETLFEFFFTSQLARVAVDGGDLMHVGEPDIISGFSTAPGGEYILVQRIKQPFSYVAPAFAFARETVVLDRDGNDVFEVHNRESVTLPRIGRDMVNQEPRQIQWRSDAPATLVWAEAMDGGNAREPAEIRDRVFILEAPFTAEPRGLIDLDQRFWRIDWGRDDLALVNSFWRTSSRTKTFIIDPSRPEKEPRLLWDRSAEDRYGNPGTPVITPSENGERLLLFSHDGRSIFLRGDGSSPDGDFPFLDKLDLETGATERLWQSGQSHYEYVVAMLDASGHKLLTRRESQQDPPNYYLRDLDTGSATALTEFPDPAPQMAGIGQQIVTYPRDDGIMLSARIFTPSGYEPEKDGPLPALLWAYPREFRDPDAASQLADSSNRFRRPAGASHLFLLTQGYAIIDAAAMPIVGAGENEPNDTYIEQLVASAKAAVNKAVGMGIADPARVAVGGHSYGAFMAANLLAHSDIFRAGVACSGAYNRTLTPFGFQAEPRSFWEAPDVYARMSPFNHAHMIKAPVLLIHGAADNNSGTFPIQSERMHQALKGHGTRARLVMLPYESHGYVARESVMHVLAEKIDWLDEHVKRAPE